MKRPGWRAAVLSGFLLNALHAQTGTALVRHAPTVNGKVFGSVHLLSGEAVSFNNGANVSASFLVPGVPIVVINGSPLFGGIQVNAGSGLPAGYKITLNSGAVLGALFSRTDPVTLPPVSAPPASTGTRSVAINSPTGTPGTFTTLRDLTLNTNVGQFSIPAGSYRNFTANKGSGFTLGISGASVPSVYNIQNLTLNSGSQLQVIGPVVLNLTNGIYANGSIGTPANPGWLQMNIYAGNFSLNGGSSVHAEVNAPNAGSTVTINGNAQLVGGLVCDGLTINTGGVLKLLANSPPSISIISPASHATFNAPANVEIVASAVDRDGTIANVEFLSGSTFIGSRSTAPYQVIWGNVPPGTFSIRAVATDNRGAVTTSPQVPVHVNALPNVSLTGPSGGDTLAAPASVTLTAIASDDGSIAKVEFYREGVLLGSVSIPEPGTAEYRFTDTPVVRPGEYTYTARTLDNLGASAESGMLTVTVLPTLPYQVDFENLEGFILGALHRQLGWKVTQGGALVVGTGAFSGSSAITLVPSAPPAQVTQTFAPLAGQNIVFIDFFTKPVAHPELSTTAAYTAAGAHFGFIGSNGQGNLRAFDSDGLTGGHWSATPFIIALNSENQSENWIRLSARLDFVGKTWDLYAAGKLVAGDLRLQNPLGTALRLFGMQGGTSGNVALDYFFAGTENPLFADINYNGIEDTWETAYGFSLENNNRASSPSGSGTTILEAYLRGSDPNDYYDGVPPIVTSLVASNGQPAAQGLIAVRVTKSDGTVLPNAPITFGLPVGSASISATPGGAVTKTLSVRTDSMGVASGYVDFNGAINVALTVTAKTSAQTASLTIALNSPIVDTDSNGLPDSWEMQHFGRVGGVDGNADEDGDRVSNLQEFVNGTDPTDYYNGVPPVVVSLVTSEGKLGPDGSLSIRITHQDGTSLVNAPATFRSIVGGHLLAAAPNGFGTMEVQARTDEQGVARVFVKAEPNQP